MLPDDGVLVEDVTQIGFAAHLAFDFRRTAHVRLVRTGGNARQPASRPGSARRRRSPIARCSSSPATVGSCSPPTSWRPPCSTASPLVTLVFNDGAYGNVKRIQQQRFGADRTIVSDLRNPDFVAFAESFGALGLRADGPGEVRPALERAFADGGPVVIDVAAPPMPDPWPWMIRRRARGRR